MTRALSFSLLLVVACVSASLASGETVSSAPEGARTQVVVALGAPPLAFGGGTAAARRIDSQQRRFATALRRQLPAAEVRWRYRIVANGLSVVLPTRDLPRLGRLPGVREVFAPATYRILAGPDAATIRARSLQGATLANAGAGTRIGIIDDGVDQRHQFFDPSGYEMPEGFPKGQTAYTTAKVIAARSFPPPGATWRHASKPFDPEHSGHATHVAGIAAGNADTPTDSGRISGIAPRAYIGNYKALTIPTDADVGLDGNAPEIVAAIEAAVGDGMDVINLSIGEPEIEPSRDVVALALDAAASAGVVPVVAAGNDFDDFGARLPDVPRKLGASDHGGCEHVRARLRPWQASPRPDPRRSPCASSPTSLLPEPRSSRPIREGGRSRRGRAWLRRTSPARWRCSCNGIPTGRRRTSRLR